MNNLGSMESFVKWSREWRDTIKDPPLNILHNWRWYKIYRREYLILIHALSIMEKYKNICR
jgi:hypothetical protein